VLATTVEFHFSHIKIAVSKFPLNNFSEKNLNFQKIYSSKKYENNVCASNK